MYSSFFCNQSSACISAVPSYVRNRFFTIGVCLPIERTAALNKWKMVGEVLVPGVLNVGDIDKTDGCKKAAELADAI